MPMITSARGNRFMRAPEMMRGFVERIASHEEASAVAATTESKVVYERWKSSRPLAPPRKGRPTTGGAFPSYLRWTRDNHGSVRFDFEDLASHAPYWLIQEIGTGKSATIMDRAESADVRSQKGRQLPGNLYWGDAPGAVPWLPMTGAGRRDAIQRHAPMGEFQQLYQTSTLGAEFTARARGRTGTIRREIKGKHFIRDGGLLGNALLRDELIADLRKSLW